MHPVSYIKSKTDDDLKRDIEKLAVRTIQKMFGTTKVDWK